MAEKPSNSEIATDKIEKENVTTESLDESDGNLDDSLKTLDESREENVISLHEIIKEEEDLLEESAAVLGGSDEKCCTYNQGYVKRQALYACLTCTPDTLAGICLACSYNCHEGHELVELYTKRNFRCDCPTDRIEKKCSFETTVTTETGKFKLNSDNIYNHNFSGVYCICKRPCPDPENKNEDDMIQCIICEDWYHSSHLNIEKSLLPKDTEYCEMTCPKCMTNLKFLQEYIGFAVNKFKDEDNIEKVNIEEKNENIDEKKDTDVEIAKQKDSDSNVDEKLKLDLDKSINDIMNIGKESTSTDQKQTTQAMEVEELSSITKENLSTEPDDDDDEEVKAKNIKLSEAEASCKRPNLINNYKKGAVFWPHDWRKQLCTCSTCKILYFKEKVEYLLDIEDTAESYADKGMKKTKKESNEQIITNLLTNSGLNHTQKINAVMGYNHLKDKLKEFLIPFVLNKRVVTSQDVKTFFEGMNREYKEQKSDKGEPSYFCR